MATIETLQKRIEGKKKEIEKLNKKIARIVKAKESNWENNPYYYNENDLKWATKDLDNAQAALEKYESDLKAAEEKAASRDVKIIIDFIEDWKRRLREFYLPTMKKYFEEYERIHDSMKDAYEKYYKNHTMSYSEYTEISKKNEADNKELSDKIYGYYEEYDDETWADMKAKAKARGKYLSITNRRHKVKDGEWEFIKDDVSGFRTYAEAEERFEKSLKVEGDRKYDFIIERTNAIVGQITDASDLEIDPRGDLNGIIVGTKGKASVRTIGAGGYNIQVFHFRTLIKPVKD